MNPLVPFVVAAVAITLTVRRGVIVVVTAWLAVAFFSLSPTASAVLALVAMTSSIVETVRAVRSRAGARRISPSAVAASAFVAGFVAAAFPPVSDEALHAIPSSAPAVEVHLDSSPGTLKITRWMHAMVLVEGGGERVLTDPWWSSRRHYDAGEALAATPSDLRTVTLVTSSQDHYDHADFEPLQQLPRATPILVPVGTAQSSRAIAAGFSSVSAMRPWQTIDLGGARVTAIPAREGVKSSDFDYETAWLYELGGRRVLFVGHRLAPDVARRVGPVDVVLLAVNDLRVRPQLGKQLSMSPKDAAEIVRATSARVAVPIHYRYRGSWLQEALLLSHTGTPEQFAEEVRKVSPATVVEILAPGQPLVVD